MELEFQHMVARIRPQMHQQKVTVDFRATLAYDDIGIYVKYSPCNVLKSDFAPKFSGISTGIVLVY